MTWVATAIVSSAVIGGISSNRAASKGAAATRDAAQLQQDQFERQVELNEPFRQAGLTAQNRLLELLGLGDNTGTPDFGMYGRDFSAQDFYADPGYAFRLSEGLKALDRQAAARGGLISGNALRGAQRFGQDLASQEFTNAFNRYQVNRSNRINPLLSLSDRSQTATGIIGAAGQSMADRVGENMMQGAAIRGSGYMGTANAFTNALNQYVNYRSDQDMMDRFFPTMRMPRGSSGITSPGGYGPMEYPGGP